MTIPVMTYFYYFQSQQLANDLMTCCVLPPISCSSGYVQLCLATTVAVQVNRTLPQLVVSLPSYFSFGINNRCASVYSSHPHLFA